MTTCAGLREKRKPLTSSLFILFMLCCALGYFYGRRRTRPGDAEAASRAVSNVVVPIAGVLFALFALEPLRDLYFNPALCTTNPVLCQDHDGLSSWLLEIVAAAGGFLVGSLAGDSTWRRGPER